MYNLGSENGFSVREIIDAAKKITGIYFTVVEESRRSGDPAVLIASSEKIRDELGWVPKCSTVNEVSVRPGNGIRDIRRAMKAENVRPVCLGSRSFCFQAVFLLK